MKDQRESTVEWVERLRIAAMKAVSEDDMREIFQGIVKRAKGGDQGATKLLMTYLQPPPPPLLPLLQPPSQKVTAHVVNIYPNGRKRKAKLLADGNEFVNRNNGNQGDK